jgi:hypothetical protein
LALIIIICVHVLRMQDVWAFGVLIFEVMGRGAQPYSEFATLAEVAERIKDGYTLGCPDNCRSEIHEQVMQPCWRPVAKRRPGYQQLRDVLVDLGATPAEDVGPSDGVPTECFVEETQSGREWKASLTNRPLLGISVHRMTRLASEVVTAVAPPWKDSRGNAVNPPTVATISHMVLAVAKPQSVDTPCPRDGQLGCAYVDTLSMRDDVGKATALLSCECCWCALRTDMLSGCIGGVRINRNLIVCLAIPIGAQTRGATRC